MTYEEIVAKVSEDTGLSRKLVDRTYKSYWRAVREHIKSLPLKEDLSEEEFNKLKPCVNIPSIGKLYVTYDRYKKIRQRYIKNTN
jgi:hypothetical protein